MTPSRSHLTTWIWLIIAALVFGRVEGAHLHLCFDGQEPPAAVHIADSADHDDAHHRDTEHVDQDVELLDATLVKKSDSHADLQVAFVPSLSLLLPVAQATSSRPTILTHPPPRRFLYLDPPPRGPPL